MKGILFLVGIVLITWIISFLTTSGFVWIICWLLGKPFSWKIAGVVWIILVMIRSLIAPIKIKN